MYKFINKKRERLLNKLIYPVKLIIVPSNKIKKYILSSKQLVLFFRAKFASLLPC